MTKKRILIIGANSALAQESISVLAANYKVITAGRKDCDMHCDIAQEIVIPDDIDVVINFAAAFGGVTDEQITEAVSTNVIGTLNVCVAAKKAGVEHIINISSLSAVLEEASPYYTIYAITKKQADELAEFYCKLNNIPLAIVRPSQIYSDNDNFIIHQPLFYEVVNKAQQGEDISLYGSNDALRNYIHATDIAEVISRIVAQQVEGTYVCTYPDDITLSQLAQTAQQVFAKGGAVKFLNDKPDVPDNIFTKDTSLYDKIGYYPQITVESGMQRMRKYREGM